MPSVDYSLSYSEYVEACRLTGGRSPRSRWWLTRAPALACSVVGFLGIMARTRFPNLVSAPALALAGAYYLWYFTGNEFNPLDRAYQTWCRAADGAKVEWDDEHIVLQTALTENRWRWTFFLDVVETGHLLLLTRASGEQRLILPKRLFTPEQVADFCRVARERIPGPSLGFPVLPR